MVKKLKGFTIVELLIVIVVIGILAAITIVAYNGVQVRALNSTRYAEMKAWGDSFELYKAANGSYPSMPDGGYCLGIGFPGGLCRDYLANNSNTYSETSSVTLMNALKTVSSLPGGQRTPINGTIGPYVNYGPGFFEITGVFNGKSTDCPSGTSYTWDDGAGRLLCYVDYSRS